MTSTRREIMRQKELYDDLTFTNSMACAKDSVEMTSNPAYAQEIM